MPPQAPDVIIDVTNNMQVELEQILNEIVNISGFTPTMPEEGEPPSEDTLIEIMIPIVQMFLETDIYPNFPWCPEATNSIIGAPISEATEQSHTLDEAAIVQGVLEQLMQHLPDP